VVLDEVLEHIGGQVEHRIDLYEDHNVEVSSRRGRELEGFWGS
jgi:hypothetical protein